MVVADDLQALYVNTFISVIIQCGSHHTRVEVPVNRVFLHLFRHIRLKMMDCQFVLPSPEAVDGLIKLEVLIVIFDVEVLQQRVSQVQLKGCALLFLVLLVLLGCIKDELVVCGSIFRLYHQHINIAHTELFKQNPATQ